MDRNIPNCHLRRQFACFQLHLLKWIRTSKTIVLNGSRLQNRRFDQQFLGFWLHHLKISRILADWNRPKRCLRPQARLFAFRWVFRWITSTRTLSPFTSTGPCGLKQIPLIRQRPQYAVDVFRVFAENGPALHCPILRSSFPYCINS